MLFQPANYHSTESRIKRIEKRRKQMTQVLLNFDRFFRKNAEWGSEEEWLIARLEDFISAIRTNKKLEIKTKEGE